MDVEPRAPGRPSRAHVFLGQRRAELEELYDAIVGGRPLWHDGRWGMATLEACLAIMQSAQERREIMLQYQVPVPAGYDADLPVPDRADVQAQGAIPP